MAVEERVIIEEEVKAESPTKTLFTQRSRCCFQFPCFGPPPKPHLTLGAPSSSNRNSFWNRIRVGESDSKWWATPIKAFYKVREWSEIVVGPKWKTFIRRCRLSRTARHRHGQAKFQYDPLSYALNFDEGPDQNAHFDHDSFLDDNHSNNNYPDFSSRYASSTTTSMDFGKGAPAS